MWVLFSFGSWGDLPAGLLAAVLLARVIVHGRAFLEGRPLTVPDGLVVGLLLIGTLYFRSSAKPLVAGLFVLLILGAVVLLTGRARQRSLAALALSAAVMVTLLAPWSIAASRTLETRVLTTTTLPVSLANTFGDRERVCYGPCDQGSSIWFAPLRYSREVARATGRSEVEIQAEMADYALDGAVTPRSYADDVSMNLNRYLLRAPGYEQQFRGVDTDLDAGALAIDAGTAALYYPLLALSLAFMLTVSRRGAGLDRRLCSVLFKLAALAFLVQPFVHVGSSRYWPIFAPVMAFAAVWWWEQRARTDATIESDLCAAEVTSRVLRRIEFALAAGFGATLAGVVVLGMV